MKDRILHLRVKVASLAAEARIIRAHERRRRGEARASLAEHRCGVVRRAARHALLALGFLRGLDYERLERNPRVSADLEIIRKEAERFGAQWDVVNGEPRADYERRVSEQAERWKAWKDAASAALDHGNAAVVAAAILCLAVTAAPYW